MLRTRLLAVCSTAALAASLTPAPVAQAAWQFSDTTLIDVRLACRDGMRVGVAVSGQGVASSDAPARVSAAQPVPEPWTPTTPLVVSAPVVVPRVTVPTTVPVDSGGGPVAVSVTHLGEFTVPSRTALATGPIAVSAAARPEGGNPNTAQVTDCYLFAPIDVVPGDRHNRVRIGGGQVSVALLGTAQLRADLVSVKTLRFGPRKAPARSSRVRDVNGDGKRDLVLTFRTSATGLTCASRAATLLGTTRSGGHFEGSAPVTPVGCPR